MQRVKSSKKYYLKNSEVLENHQVSQNYLNGGALAKPEMVRTIAKTVAHKGLCSGRPFWLWLTFRDSFSLFHFFWRSKRTERSELAAGK
jgi:hypothetical protein